MKRMVKWAVLAVVVLAAFGFVGFLYFVPPLMSTDPQEFINGEAAMAPPVDGIADPAVRALAERGRYVLLTTECTGCHVTPGPQGPLPDMYLAGGRGSPRTRTGWWSRGTSRRTKRPGWRHAPTTT